MKGHNYGICKKCGKNHLPTITSANFTDEYRRKISIARMGQHPSEETKRKIGNARRGYKHSEETKRKIGLGNKGKSISVEHRHAVVEANRRRIWSEESRREISRAMKNRYISEGHRRKIGDATRGRKHTTDAKEKMRQSALRNWHNPIYREKTIKSVLKSLFKRPTKFEQKMIQKFSRLNLPYKYVGDGSFLIGYRNPDFININGQKICVEIRPKNMCKYWNNCSPEEYAENRITHFGKYGWKCIIIWHDDNDEIIADKLMIQLGKEVKT